MSVILIQVREQKIASIQTSQSNLYQLQPYSAPSVGITGCVPHFTFYAMLCL